MTEQEFLNEYSNLLRQLVDKFLEDLSSKLHLDCDTLIDKRNEYFYTLTYRANIFIAYLIDKHNLSSNFKPTVIITEPIDSYLLKLSASIQLNEYERYKVSTNSLLEKCYSVAEDKAEDQD